MQTWWMWQAAVAAVVAVAIVVDMDVPLLLSLSCVMDMAAAGVTVVCGCGGCAAVLATVGVRESPPSLKLRVRGCWWTGKTSHSHFKQGRLGANLLRHSNRE